MIEKDKCLDCEEIARLKKETGPKFADGDSYSKWKIMDWYDGPLAEAAIITSKDGYRLIEMKTHGGWVGEETRAFLGDGHCHFAHFRLTREQLQFMIDLLDGKDPKDFFNE